METFSFGKPSWDSLKRPKIQGNVGSTFSGTHSLAAVLNVFLQPGNMCLSKSPDVQPPKQETMMQPCIKQANSTLGCMSCSTVGQCRGPFPFAQYFWDGICSAIPSLGLPSVAGALEVQQAQQKPTRMVRGLEHTMWEKREREFVCSARRDT